MPDDDGRKARRQPRHSTNWGGRRTGTGPKAKVQPVAEAARGTDDRIGLPDPLSLARDGGLTCRYMIDGSGQPVIDPEDAVARTNWLTLDNPLGAPDAAATEQETR